MNKKLETEKRELQSSKKEIEKLKVDLYELKVLKLLLRLSSHNLNMNYHFSERLKKSITEQLFTSMHGCHQSGEKFQAL